MTCQSTSSCSRSPNKGVDFFGTPSLSPPRQDNIQWNWPTVNPKARSSPQITHLQSFCTTARSNQQPRCQWPRRGWLSKWSCCRGCPSRWQSRSSREDFDWHLPLCSSAWYCPASNPHLIWRKEKGAGSPSTLEILRNTFEIENSYCISYDQPSELRFHSIFKKKCQPNQTEGVVLCFKVCGSQTGPLRPSVGGRMCPWWHDHMTGKQRKCRPRSKSNLLSGGFFWKMGSWKA